MSVTTSIVCDRCEETLWIGQRNYIYSGNETVMHDLNVFLQVHRSEYRDEHVLLFVDEHDERTWEYAEFRGDAYDEYFCRIIGPLTQRRAKTVTPIHFPALY